MQSQKSTIFVGMYNDILAFVAEEEHRTIQ